MKIIISPAKRMKADLDSMPVRTSLLFPEKSQALIDYLRGIDYRELKALLKCNDSIAEENFRRYAAMDGSGPKTPALFAYQGIQYQYMGATAFTDEEYDYLQSHLVILSGLLGCVRPFDGIVPYRLEMQAKLRTDFCDNLYDYWGEELGAYLSEDTDFVLDLASEEYSKAARHGLTAPRIVAVFAVEKDGKLLEKGTQVKMVRGAMVRYLAENQITDPADICRFRSLDYQFSPAHSTDSRLVFLKNAKKV